MSPLFCCQKPLLDAAAQSIIQRRVRENSKGPNISSKKLICFSIANFFKTDSVFPVLGFIPPVPGYVPSLAPALASTNDLFRQLMQAYIEDYRHLAPASAQVES